MTKLTEYEMDVVRVVLRDDAQPRPLGKAELHSIEVVERLYSEIGVITEIRETPASTLYEAHVGLRWGAGYHSMVNRNIPVGIVVYVDAGVLNCIELVTLLGDPWPSRIQEFSAPRPGPLPGAG